MQFNKDLLYGFGDAQHGTSSDCLLQSAHSLTVLLQSAHRRIDTTVEDTADASDAATAYALANSLKAKFMLTLLLLLFTLQQIPLTR